LQVAAEIQEAVAASRNDPPPAIEANTVCTELDAAIDQVAAEPNRS
jgi:antitoxin StbD